jgi:hypothetical protein
MDSQRFSGIQRLWFWRGVLYCVVGLFILVGVFVFANWQNYLAVGLGGLLIGASWFWWAYESAASDRDRRRSGASPEAARQGFDTAGWGKPPDR